MKFLYVAVFIFSICCESIAEVPTVSEGKNISEISSDFDTYPLVEKPSFSAPSHISMTTPKNFVYFMDNFTQSNIQNTPIDFAIIGESQSTGPISRSTLTNAGRVVGTQTEFNQSSRITWTPELHILFNGAVPDLSTLAKQKTFAMQILVASGITLNSSGTPGGGFPIAAENEWQPTSSNGYVLYTQDVEGPVGSVPEESAAAMTAVMWASRVTLGPNMKIIPVPANALLIETAANWNLESVLLGNSNDNYVKYLNLQSTLSTAQNAALTAKQIDLFSLLHIATAQTHPLIDGILAQQYSIHDASTPPGQVNCDAPPGSMLATFYDTNLPYSILSAHDNPAQLFIDTNPNCSTLAKPWSSYHHETMPFLAGIYWSGSVDPITTFNPSDYLVPTLLTTNPFCEGDIDNSGIVDLIDILAVISAWGFCEGCAEDIDDNNTIDVHDLLAVFSAWGVCPG